MKKNAMLTVAAGALIMSVVLFLIIYATNKDISIYVNGSKVVLTEPAVVKNGVVYVQEEPIFEKLGFTDVKYMQDIDTYFALRGEQTYIIYEARNKLVLCSNGNLDLGMKSAQLCSDFFGDRDQQSIYYLAERYNCDVNWDKQSHAVYFKEKNNEVEEVAIIYSLNARKVVLIKDLDTWIDDGWYTEPVAKVYADGGKTIIVKLKEVAEYRKKGWKPITTYIFESSFDEIQKHFGKLIFEEFYSGTPDSGDVPRNYYSNSKDSDVHIEISFWKKYATCLTLRLKLKDVFPYLNLYADSGGDLLVDRINDALDDNGIYGSNYRDVGEQIYDIYSNFRKLNYYKSGEYYVYYFEYDGLPAYIYTDTFNHIDINTAICCFDILT